MAVIFLFVLAVGASITVTMKTGAIQPGIGRLALRFRHSGAALIAGSMAPKVRAACWFAERTAGFAATGSIHDTQALLRGEAGTRVALHAAVGG